MAAQEEAMGFIAMTGMYALVMIAGINFTVEGELLHSKNNTRAIHFITWGIRIIMGMWVISLIGAFSAYYVSLNAIPATNDIGHLPVARAHYVFIQFLLHSFAILFFMFIKYYYGDFRDNLGSKSELYASKKPGEKVDWDNFPKILQPVRGYSYALLKRVSKNAYVFGKAGVKKGTDSDDTIGKVYALITHGYVIGVFAINCIIQMQTWYLIPGTPPAPDDWNYINVTTVTICLILIVFSYWGWDTDRRSFLVQKGQLFGVGGEITGRQLWVCFPPTVIYALMAVNLSMYIEFFNDTPRVVFAFIIGTVIPWGMGLLSGTNAVWVDYFAICNWIIWTAYLLPPAFGYGFQANATPTGEFVFLQFVSNWGNTNAEYTVASTLLIRYLLSIFGLVHCTTGAALHYIVSSYTFDSAILEEEGIVGVKTLVIDQSKIEKTWGQWCMGGCWCGASANNEKKDEDVVDDDSVDADRL